MRQIVYAIYLAVVAGTLVLGVPASATSKSRSLTVVIENMKYSPEKLEISPNDSVTWVNKDLVPHTVTSSDKFFDSQIIAPGASWKWQPSKPGSYSYKCTLHPTMLGSMIVK